MEVDESGLAIEPVLVDESRDLLDPRPNGVSLENQSVPQGRVRRSLRPVANAADGNIGLVVKARLTTQGTGRIINFRTLIIGLSIIRFIYFARIIQRIGGVLV